MSEPFVGAIYKFVVCFPLIAQIFSSCEGKMHLTSSSYSEEIIHPDLCWKPSYFPSIYETLLNKSPKILRYSLNISTN